MTESFSQSFPRSHVPAAPEPGGAAPAADVEHAVTVAEAAERLGVSRARMRELFAEGRIRPVRIGGRTMVPSCELVRVLCDVT
jgi:excisionase family DNA binding protein